jgi:hypothetical protein
VWEWDLYTPARVNSSDADKHHKLQENGCGMGSRPRRHIIHAMYIYHQATGFDHKTSPAKPGKFEFFLSVFFIESFESDGYRICRKSSFRASGRRVIEFPLGDVGPEARVRSIGAGSDLLRLTVGRTSSWHHALVWLSVRMRRSKRRMQRRMNSNNHRCQVRWTGVLRLSNVCGKGDVEDLAGGNHKLCWLGRRTAHSVLVPLPTVN